MKSTVILLAGLSALAGPAAAATVASVTASYTVTLDGALPDTVTFEPFQAADDAAHDETGTGSATAETTILPGELAATATATASAPGKGFGSASATANTDLFGLLFNNGPSEVTLGFTFAYSYVARFATEDLAGDDGAATLFLALVAGDDPVFEQSLVLNALRPGETSDSGGFSFRLVLPAGTGSDLEGMIGLGAVATAETALPIPLPAAGGLLLGALGLLAARRRPS